MEFHREHGVMKVGDTKFFQCPRSYVTSKTWAILKLVNETTDTDGNILLLPYPGCLMDQPDWWRDAVEIVKVERLKHRKRTKK